MRGRAALLLCMIGLMTVAPAVQASHLPDETGVLEPVLELEAESNVIDLCDGGEETVTLRTHYRPPQGSVLLHTTEIWYTVWISSQDLSAALSPQSHHPYIPPLQALQGEGVELESYLTFVAADSGPDCEVVQVTVDAFAEKNGNVDSQERRYTFLVKAPVAPA